MKDFVTEIDFLKNTFCLPPPQALFVFHAESSAKREWLVTKPKEPWEGERRETRFLLPAFLCAQTFSEREKSLGTRQIFCLIKESPPPWKQRINKSRLSLIVRVNVVLNRTVVVDSDWRFDNLCGSHQVSCITDRRPITSRRNWPIRSITRVYHQLTWYNSLWLWRWPPLRLSKRQSLSTTTVLFRTTFTQTIKLNLLFKWLLGSNLSQRINNYGQNITRESWNNFRSLVLNSGIPVPYFADTGITGSGDVSSSLCISRSESTMSILLATIAPGLWESCSL